MNLSIEQDVLVDITASLKNGFGDHVRSGFLTGKIDGNEVKVSGVIIPRQQSNKIYTDFSYDEAKGGNKNIVGQIVYYPEGIALFESAISRKSRQDFASRGFPNFGITVNSKGKYVVNQD